LGCERVRPTAYKPEDGNEEAFVRCFTALSDEEKNRHGIIRAYTTHPIRAVNQAMSDWVREDIWFKTMAVTSKNGDALAAKLRDMEIHLMLWHAKYEYWIPDKPQHALVFLADEEEHGLGFPRGIEGLVDAALVELRRRWLKSAFKSVSGT
jgi:hypothetical protein